MGERATHSLPYPGIFEGEVKMGDVVVAKIPVALHFKYAGATGKIGETVVYFEDATTLRLDGHYEFLLGQTYKIIYPEGDPPVEPDSIDLISKL